MCLVIDMFDGVLSFSSIGCGQKEKHISSFSFMRDNYMVNMIDLLLYVV